ncbi:MAG: hypothetical protein ACK4GQ_03465, partial [Candidatus Hadarchaeales archaeon]
MSVVRQFKVLMDNKGISAIVGFVLVIAVMTAALSTYISAQVPWEWKEKEQNMVQQVKQNFLKFRGDVAGLAAGETAAMVVDLSASSPTAYVPGESSSRLDVSTARFIANLEEVEDNANPFSWWRGVGTYVKEAEPNFTITSPGYDNNILVVSTTRGSPPPFFKQGTPALTKLLLLSALAVLLMVLDVRLRLT